ncbi:MAG: hypothetical protein K2N63_17640, partial [Lachnospiraceae bacterium]|nr:hypothetical protein [Lachnospiraceae bacterium]
SVPDTAMLACILDGMGAQYRILSEKEADIYAKINLPQLILALSEKGCNVESIQERDESLESYYISLVGGGTQKADIKNNGEKGEV